MVLWNFELLWKTIVLWTKLWYYTERYGTSIYEGKKHGRLPKNSETLIYNGENMEIYQNN